MSVTAFDLAGPLPEGTFAIEASAGTGKTYALAALAVRFLAERDVSVSQLLVVTFTRAATAELRDRIRRRIAEAVAHLDPQRDPVAVDDPLLTHLAATDADERARRHARLVVSVDDGCSSRSFGEGETFGKMPVENKPPF